MLKSLVVLLLFLSPIFTVQASPKKCAAAIAPYFTGKSKVLSDPTLDPSIELIEENSKKAVQLLIKAGFQSKIAQRMIDNREFTAPYILAKRKEVKFSNRTVVDSGRGWKKGFQLKKLKRASSLKPIIVWRGLEVEELHELVLNSKNYNNPMRSSDDLFFGSTLRGEAEHYAGVNNAYPSDDFDMGIGILIKMEIPAGIFFKLDDHEGFLIPEHYRNLESFIVSVYQITNRDLNKPIYKQLSFDGIKKAIEQAAKDRPAEETEN